MLGSYYWYKKFRNRDKCWLNHPFKYFYLKLLKYRNTIVHSKNKCKTKKNCQVYECIMTTNLSKLSFRINPVYAIKYKWKWEKATKKSESKIYLKIIRTYNINYTIQPEFFKYWILWIKYYLLSYGTNYPLAILYKLIRK